MTTITDVRDALIAGAVMVDKWYDDWQARFLDPEFKAAARNLVASVPPDVLEQFALDHPDDWDDLMAQLE